MLVLHYLNDFLLFDL